MKKKVASPLPAPTMGLEQQQQAAEGKLRESLGKNLGSGYEESTPAIQALGELRQRSGEIQKGAQSGELTPEEAAIQAQEETSRIPSSGTPNLPVRSSLPTMNLSELARMQTKKKYGGRFKVNPYGVEQIG